MQNAFVKIRFHISELIGDYVSLQSVSHVKFLLTHDGFRENLRKVATGTSGSMLNISKAKLS